MSRGLGDNYLTDSVKEYHRKNIDKLYLRKKNGNIIAMPKYYRDKIFSEEEKERQLYIIHDAVEAKIEQDIKQTELEGRDYVTDQINLKKGRRRILTNKNRKL